ncbi:MAG: 1,4-alpha-glucan branching protein GlgB [Lactobacillales bacterium]|jgi:1,4-alpha-glucan branching enzyme|nr:1,4-alpha-glucan branching protein GlgB [Lactobacillales bacterium]
MPEKFDPAKKFNTGENFYSHHYLGCHKEKKGFVFRVWAPNARNVWLAGDFTDWDENEILMEKDHENGIWELWTDKAKPGDLYKFDVERASGHKLMKMDPFAIRMEKRPGVAGVVTDVAAKKWKDGRYIGKRKKTDYFHTPMNIYEMHASSWKHHEDGTAYTIKELTKELIPYLLKMNYTHVEFMPLTEHPLGMSWGYQATGYFSLCSLYGEIEDLQEFVEECHLNNIGVFMDWVPGHFCVNDDALRYYDGTPTFEYHDHDRAHMHRWGALNFDLGKPQVQSFLISSAMFWLDFFHIDGIRVDAVSNMLYLDYDDGAWTPNQFGDNRNLEGMEFLKKFNAVVKLAFPHAITMAEESSSGTKITGMIEMGGLGFDFKWNMGWMNDILRFFEMDPFFRKYHMDLLTFSMCYMFDENFILPISHDEVVHGKMSMLQKAWHGDKNNWFDESWDQYRQFAELRLMYAYMIMHPGKKLNFMGNDIAQYIEWRYDEGLEWFALDQPFNAKFNNFVSKINEFYKSEKALSAGDTSYDGFEFINADDSKAIYAFIRKGKTAKDNLIVVCNFDGEEQQNYPVGVPFDGVYEEVLNTESEDFGGTWVHAQPDAKSEANPYKQFAQRINVTVPAYGATIFKPKKIKL